MKKVSLLALFFISLSLLGCGADESATIKVGGILDLTGPTSGIGQQYLGGVRDYFDYINTQGGINGRQVELIYDDYVYELPRATNLYQRLVKEEKVIALLGWDVADTAALQKDSARDHVPFFTTSFSEQLVLPENSSYIFFVGATHSDQIKIVLHYIHETWRDSTRRPRVAFIYNDTPFGQSPLADGHEYAASRDIEIVAEIMVPLAARDASTQMGELVQSEADYAIVQETPRAMATILRDASRMRVETQFIALDWATNEKTIALAGDAAENLLGTAPFVFVHEVMPGTEAILSYAEQIGRPLDKLSIRYVAGWTTAMVLLEGVRRAGDDLSGPGLRQAMESIKNFDSGGLLLPISFGPESHRTNPALRIFQVQSGQWVPITDYILNP
ncbi:MAG: ABC transporter substrate-binding protein [Chloroflexia bacterium]|nr:ABC transporter substrate-binding protein [Chloroflexia bacterium]